LHSKTDLLGVIHIAQILKRNLKMQVENKKSFEIIIGLLYGIKISVIL
jgi:hypothetical protein